ncbi:hypothetical protein MHM582_2341 [Microbacterium sp. HM58-2]|nr:hypothetical protein MHM582_2341 [Microbacterium sp. HM58-2]
MADTGGDGVRLAGQDLRRARAGELGHEATLLGEVGSAEGNCNSCGVEKGHVRERTNVQQAGALTTLYNLVERIASVYKMRRMPW